MATRHRSKLAMKAGVSVVISAIGRGQRDDGDAK